MSTYLSFKTAVGSVWKSYHRQGPSKVNVAQLDSSRYVFYAKEAVRKTCGIPEIFRYVGGSAVPCWCLNHPSLETPLYGLGYLLGILIRKRDNCKVRSVNSR